MSNSTVYVFIMRYCQTKVFRGPRMQDGGSFLAAKALTYIHRADESLGSVHFLWNACKTVEGEYLFRAMLMLGSLLEMVVTRHGCAFGHFACRAGFFSVEDLEPAKQPDRQRSCLHRTSNRRTWGLKMYVMRRRMILGLQKRMTQKLDLITHSPSAWAELASHWSL